MRKHLSNDNIHHISMIRYYKKQELYHKITKITVITLLITFIISSITFITNTMEFITTGYAYILALFLFAAGIFIMTRNNKQNK